MLGDTSADVIYGGTENDTVYGGTSGDTIYGGAGYDRIYGDDHNDSLLGDGNSDTIYGGAGNDVIDGGTAADLLYGGENNDNLVGGSNNDTLNGGLDNDTLTGGSGSDAFAFSSLSATSFDVITDFSVAGDTIWLSDTIFTVLPAGALAANAFVANTTGLAASVDHRMIYETDTGAVFYDVDGNGANARVQIAAIAAGLVLTEADFFVF